MEANNGKLQDLIKDDPTVWDFMRGLRAAYNTDFKQQYNVKLLRILICARF
jgi:hypothetical protein